uniref:TOG domain-containing protein n=1 Tax=Electrophorus electricus TaxID=8005 RepID=A0A4W4G779_ELEEL
MCNVPCQATAQLKQAFKDPAIIPALCTVMTQSANPQVDNEPEFQHAANMLRLHFLISKSLFIYANVCFYFFRHTVHHSLSQLSAAMVKNEAPDRWPALLKLLNESTNSNNPQDRQLGLLLLSKVVESNPEPFKPHYKKLLQLFGTVLQDGTNPTPFLGEGAMEVLDELMESEVSIVVPYIAEIVQFCLEVADVSLSDSLRVKTLSCIALLIRLKSKAVLKHKLLAPILQVVFPILSAEPPLGEEDPEDKENGDGSSDSESPKHFAAQVIDTMALHMPPEKLFNQLMPMIQACLASKNPYERKGGLMSLAVLAEGCADHIRTKMLSSVLQTVCHSLSDSNQVVRSAGLFALGQFSEYLQPEVSKYHAELMPLLLGYMSSLKEAKIGHVTKAFYALENFLENLGKKDIQSYLPTLMETMFSALNTTDNLKLKELAVSAIGAIANAAKEMLVPYFSLILFSLSLSFSLSLFLSLTHTHIDTLSVLARTIGKDVFSPLAAECVQLGLNLTNSVDDPDLRRCTYSLFSAVSSVSPESLTPHLTAITTLMLLSLKSTEGVMVSAPSMCLHMQEFCVLPSLYPCVCVCACAHQFPHEDVRRAAFGAIGHFCRAQHKVWQDNPTEGNHQALQKLLGVVLPCFMEAVKQERERHVVMGVLEAMNAVIKSCKEEALQSPDRLAEISHTIRDVLKKKTVCQDAGGDEADDDDQQAEYDAMLQEFAGEGIPILASAVPAETFYPHLNDLLPLIMNKAKSSCTVADRSFSVGTLGETLQSLVNVQGGRAVAGRLSNRLLPVLVAGVKDSDAEVRNNSVFGLGALAEAAGPIISSNYPMMLSLFSNLLVKESDRRVIDNLCAALCRMIMSHMDGVPLEQVLTWWQVIGFGLQDLRHHPVLVFPLL